MAGALAVIRYAKINGIKHRPWLTALLARRPTKVAAIALANKIARMAWAMMAKGIEYDHVVQALPADRANEGGRKPCAKISVGAGGCIPPCGPAILVTQDPSATSANRRGDPGLGAGGVYQAFLLGFPPRRTIVSE